MEFNKVPDIAKYLSTVFMVAFLGINTVWYFLPVYFEQNISNVFLIGLLTSLPPLVSIMLDIPTGNMVQRAGEKVILFIGLTMAIFPGMFYLLATPLALFAGKFFEGLNKVMIWNGGWSLSLKSSSEEVEAETVSVFLLGANLAAIIGPIIGGFLIASYGFQVPFYIWIFTTALSVIVFYSYLGSGNIIDLENNMGELLERKSYIDDWHHLEQNKEKLKLPFSLIFFYSIIFSFFWLAVPLLLEDSGADYITMGIIFGAAALPSAFQFIFADFADKLGRVKTLTVLSIAIIPFLLGMALTSSVIILGVLFFFARLISDGMSPAIHAIFDERAPDEIEGELNGFNELFKHIGQFIGPLMAGAVASAGGLEWAFIVAAAVAVIIFFISIKELRT